jgi:RNA polymerase sigma factor (sigma-70 family)
MSADPRSYSKLPSDGTLVAHAKHGDCAAIEILLSRYQRQAYWKAYRILHHVQDTEDAVGSAAADTVERLSRGKVNLRRASFGPYYLTVVHNKACAMLRAAGELPTDPLTGDDGAARDVAVDCEEIELMPERLDFRAAFRELGPRDRDVLFLRHIKGLSHKGVAEVIGNNEGAARQAALAARVKLRCLLDSEDP